jgi:hypothetical protein
LLAAAQAGDAAKPETDTPDPAVPESKPGVSDSAAPAPVVAVAPVVAKAKRGPMIKNGKLYPSVR